MHGGEVAMKKTVFALAALLCGGLALLPDAARSQVPGQPGKGLPFGPGDKGAVFKAPWENSTPPAPTGASSPSYIQSILSPSGTAGGDPKPASPSTLLPYDNTSINNDILVTKDLGAWMILVASYSGRDGPQLARQMVSVLWTHYKLRGYVFNYGAEEKRKELERVRKLIEERKEALKRDGLPYDAKQHVKHAHIDEHCGVLLGGFPSQEAAAKARDQMKTLKTPDLDVFKV
jgi:hypothetical protein